MNFIDVSPGSYRDSQYTFSDSVCYPIENNLAINSVKRKFNYFKRAARLMRKPLIQICVYEITVRSRFIRRDTINLIAVRDSKVDVRKALTNSLLLTYIYICVCTAEMEIFIIKIQQTRLPSTRIDTLSVQ